VSVPAAEFKNTSKEKQLNMILNNKYIFSLVAWVKKNASWSWVSIPSLLLAWVLIATQFESYILPQPWEVVDEAWNEMLFPDAGVQIDDDGNEIILSAEDIVSTWGLFSQGNVGAGFNHLFRGELWPHLGWSLLEVIGGFGAAVICSVWFGFMSGFFKGFREYLVPLNGLFMAIPPIAWAPLMLIIFGIGYTTIVIVIFISAVNPMILTIMEGVLQIQGQEVRAARVLGAKKWQLFLHVYLPASLPFITAALRIGFSQAWRALVAAEMIGASVGVGYMLQTGGEVGNSRVVLLGIVLIGFLSYLFERLLFRPIEKRYEVWRLDA
jgi:ABC-type nitrate/sulfonate/bicarbonate transport system permease component